MKKIMLALVASLTCSLLYADTTGRVDVPNTSGFGTLQASTTLGPQDCPECSFWVNSYRYYNGTNTWTYVYSVTYRSDPSGTGATAVDLMVGKVQSLPLDYGVVTGETTGLTAADVPDPFLSSACWGVTLAIWGDNVSCFDHRKPQITNWLVGDTLTVYLQSTDYPTGLGTLYTDIEEPSGGTGGMALSGVLAPDWDNDELPEPASLWLVGTALLMLALAVRYSHFVSIRQD